MNCHALLCAVGAAVALSFACEAALPAAPAPCVPVNCIQRPMKALAESTPGRPAEVRGKVSKVAAPDYSFEADGRGWRLAKPNWSVVDGVGRNGSRGLVCACADTNLYQISSASVPWRSGHAGS